MTHYQDEDYSVAHINTKIFMLNMK